MKIRKTVSEEVVNANRANAEKSPGPRDCTNVKHNARKHGLRAKKLFFKDEEEEKQYDALLEELEDDNEPEGATEWMLVEEIARCWWKLRDLEGWEIQEFADRRKASRAILRAIRENYDGGEVPLFTDRVGADSAAELGWECQELVVRSSTANSEQQTSGYADQSKTGKAGHTYVEARLQTSIETILRYKAALKRDLYRAIRTLREIQRERRGE